MTKDNDIERLTVEEGYSLADLKRTLKGAWTRSYKHQNGNARSQKILGARHRLSFAWNHFMVTRGQSIRDAKLSHLFPQEYATSSEGRQYSFGVALRIPQGKTNQDHAIHSCIVRNKDAEICPVGCLAFYLLELWKVCFLILN